MNLEKTELLRQEEQARLDIAMGPELRNRAGQFATPPLLADEVVRYCADYLEGRTDSIRFLEPSCGTGSFYSSFCRNFSKDAIELAFACELDQEHARVAVRLWTENGLIVKRSDFLLESPPTNKFNLLIANPPYVRHHHLPSLRKEELQAMVRERLRINISGLAGLYCYFLLLADSWLAESALSAWLIPSEFLDVNYGSALKEYLTERVRLLHIHRFSPEDVQFADALVSSAVVVFEKRPPDDREVSFSLGGSLRSPQRIARIRQSELRPCEKWSKYINGISSGSRHAASSILFGDLFTIKRGLATGNNDFFILTREKAKAIGIPEQFLRAILPSPRNLSNIVIEADDTGYAKLDPQLALIDCACSEENIKRKFPAFWKYLEAGKSLGVHKTYLTSRRIPWYSQEDRPPPPFLCSYMGRSGAGRKPFRFFWNKSRATAPNVYLLLYPKGPMRRALERDGTLYQAVFEALQSFDMDVLKEDGRVYGGGLFKMEPQELSRIPAEALAGLLELNDGVALVRQPGLFDG